MIIAASDRTLSAERRGLRVTAEALYHQSADIWGDMRKNGTLSSPDAIRFDRLTREIAESHDALKK
jgi:hypothetical protein